MHAHNCKYGYDYRQQHAVGYSHHDYQPPSYDYADQEAYATAMTNDAGQQQQQLGAGCYNHHDYQPPCDYTTDSDAGQQEGTACYSHHDYQPTYDYVTDSDAVCYSHIEQWEGAPPPPLLPGYDYAAGMTTDGLDAIAPPHTHTRRPPRFSVPCLTSTASRSIQAAAINAGEEATQVRGVTRVNGDSFGASGGCGRGTDTPLTPIP